MGLFFSGLETSVRWAIPPVLLSNIGVKNAGAIAADVGKNPELAIPELVATLTILLLVATGVALLSRRFRVPYVTGLVLAGLAITELLPKRLGLDSDLILNIFLPILLFQAAINTDVSRLRSTIQPIFLLAGPGVAIASSVTAVLLKFGLGLDWIPALLGGIILAVTDTVSVIAVFKEVAVPPRLATIVEGESLFNDGAALVLFTLVAQIHTTGTFSPTGAVQQLILVIVGGSLLGLAIGYLSAGLFKAQADDPLSGILLTVAVAFGTFQVGHWLQVSGVVAVVVAGLAVGNLGLSQCTSASSKITLLNFWEYAGFCVNTFVFLLIGIDVHPQILFQSLPAILLAIAAYQVGRILTVYPLLATVSRTPAAIPFRWQHVLFLGNIKGSLSMVLALSLPMTLVGRSELIAIVYGAVFLSVIGQGLTLPWIIQRLHLVPVSESHQYVEDLQAQLIAAKAAQMELASLLESGILPKAVHEEMRASYQVQVAKAEKQLRELYNRRSEDLLEHDRANSKLDAVRRRLLLVEKGALTDAVRKQILSESTIHARLQAIDEQLLNLEEE